MRRPTLLLVAAALAAGFLPAPYGGKLEAPLPDQPVTLDPALATRESELQVISVVYDPLYALDRRGEARPHLVLPAPARAPPRRPGALRLRPGVQLSNGRALRASHVVAALRRVKKSPGAYLLSPIKAVSAAGQDGIRIQLRAPCPHLPTLLASPTAGIAVSQGKELLGTGPFKIASAAGSGITLRANSRHFAGRPYLDQLRLRVFGRASAEVAAFQAGALHLSFNGASLFGAGPRQVVGGVESRACATLYLGVGQQPGYLSAPLFRQALMAAIHRKRLARLMGGGKRQAARGPVCQALMGKSRRGPGFNRTAARKLLARAAARLPELARAMAGGARPRLELLVDGSRPGDRALAGQIVADLDGVGISARIEVRMAAEYQARLQSGRYELLVGRLIPQVPLGAAVLAASFAAGGKEREARACLARRPCGRLVAARFMKDLPLLPLLHLSTRIHHDARLGGLQADSLGRVRYSDMYWVRRGE